ncbi:alcohol dehydrogenase [Ktedonobacter sp. SOSP1-52]|uniref:quinone oxidoreductase family protein n=1 Tax=Ktedonobacter sp. SOSP1-52 TaxID=2778366 RepID=UPI0019156594|nr:zinc-binding alcohol dehydrogenase family protein [Ktedonobacter sp. SOSP1-52]GHO71345.1 alcohol dehydrogenase [Ktedonobacter sp. SOSP1-52]
MKAAILKTIGQPLTIEDIPEPVPGAGEVLVRVLAAPVLAYAQEVFTGQRHYPLLLPLAPGCGAVGLVEKIGPDATRLKPGQLVFCDPTVRSRDDALSPDIMLQGWVASGEGPQKLQAHFRNGSFAEKMLLPLENAFSLNHVRSIDPAKLTWLNTLLVPYSGFLAAGLQPGQVVMVNGATGHFGSAAVAIAVAMGAARVVALGRNEQALNTLVRQFGSRVRPVLLSADETTGSNRLREGTEGSSITYSAYSLSEDEAMNRKRFMEAAEGPIDCLLDILGPIHDSAPTRRGIMAVRPGGTAVLMGGVQANLDIPYNYVMRNNLVIRGQWMCPRHAPSLLVELIHSGLLALEPFSVSTFSLEQVSQAVQHAHDHGGAFQLTVLKPSSL